MNTIIIVAALCTTALLITVFAWLRRRGGVGDLGTVSDNWIAEQKFGPGGDSRR